MADNTLKGKRVLDNARPPKVHSEQRTCAKRGCDTTLSRYNRREYCYAHAPTKFPRLRGRVVPES
jgi:hypothetical protein